MYEREAAGEEMRADARTVSETARPWGPFVTLFAVGATVYASLVASLTIGVVAVTSRLPPDAPQRLVERRLQRLLSNGDFLSASVFVSGAVFVAAALMLGGMRRGIRVRDYIAFHPVPARTLLAWTALMPLIGAGTAIVGSMLGRPDVPEFIVRPYRTASSLPLLFSAMILVAPLAEEVLYRGFMFRGFEREGWHPAIAIVITSAVWAVTHAQYDAFDQTIVFVMGIAFGTARSMTGSISAPLAMHVATNAIAAANTAYYLQDLRPG